MTYLGEGCWHKGVIELEHSELRGVEQLVAELAIPLNTEDLEVDIASWTHSHQLTRPPHTVATGRHTSTAVRTQRKPQRIRPTLRDALREVLLLPALRLRDLLVVQIALIQLLVQRLEVQSLDHINRINDVPQTLAHLAPMRVTDHGVAVHLLEGHLARQVRAEEDHARDPEEDDVPPGLEHGRGVESVEVESLPERGISL